jgi:hypothetical protein
MHAVPADRYWDVSQAQGLMAGTLDAYRLFFPRIGDTAVATSRLEKESETMASNRQTDWEAYHARIALKCHCGNCPKSLAASWQLHG